MMVKIITRIMKTVTFLGIFVILFSYCSYLFLGYTDYNYQQSAVFFEEPKDSLDAVYIGASPTFTSWIAPLAWKKYGITVRTYANDSRPFITTKNMIEIARKKQPDAVYLIAINGIYGEEGMSVESAHCTTDYLPCSAERFQIINQLCDYFHFTSEERLELFIPIIRYHSRWNVLSKASFHRDNDTLHSGNITSSFLSMKTDISKSYCETSESEPLPGFTQGALQELLDYCKNENIKVVFVLSAQYREKLVAEWFNTIIGQIEAYGFPLINEIEDFNIIGLDDTTDFYNAKHTNIHGALKITDYLSQYLLSHYDFSEKSGGYESWDEAYDKYKEIITPYLTEEELKQLP